MSCDHARAKVTALEPYLPLVMHWECGCGFRCVGYGEPVTSGERDAVRRLLAARTFTQPESKA